MKRTLFFLSIIVLAFPLVTFGQEGGVEQEEVLTARIKSPEFVRAGKKIIFDATESTLEGDLLPRYSWDFGDGTGQGGQEVVHQYFKTGQYEVSLRISQGRKIATSSKDIFVFERSALLLVDDAKGDDIAQIAEQAAGQGVALTLLSVEEEEGGFITEDRVVGAITERADVIRESDMLLFYTKSSQGLQAFTRYWSTLDTVTQESLRNKFFVVITDGSIDIAANVVFQSFRVIEPKHILLTRVEALNPLFTQIDTESISELLQSRGIEFQVVDSSSQKSIWFFLSRAITAFIAKGASANALYLILIIPFLTFFTIFMRHVVGVSTFGVFTPTMITASFYVLGIGFGLLTFVFAVMSSYVVKWVLNKFELLYLPKVALNLSFLSLSFLIVIWIMLLLDTQVSLSVAIFPMLVMSTLSEKFMAAKMEEGLRSALIGVIETLVVVMFSYYIIIWPKFYDLVLSWPELILLPMIITLILGKFTGLRISEYFRFRSLFSEYNE